MSKLETAFVQANRVIVAVTLAAIFLIVFANVVGRYGFGASLPWAEEVARHLMIFGAFAGAGLALREGKLVAIDVAVDSLAGKGMLGRMIRWGGVFLMAAFMVALVWFGSRFVAFGWNKETMATQISRGIPYLAIPIGAGLFLIHLLLFARRYVERAFHYTSDDDES